MFWNIAKRRVQTGTLIKVVKKYQFDEETKDKQLKKAKRFTNILNLKNYIFKKYYYRVEFSEKS